MWEQNALGRMATTIFLLSVAVSLIGDLAFLFVFCLQDSASVTSAIALLDYCIRRDILATLTIVFHRIHSQHWLSYFIGYTHNIDGHIHTYIAGVAPYLPSMWGLLRLTPITPTIPCVINNVRVSFRFLS